MTDMDPRIVILKEYRERKKTLWERLYKYLFTIVDKKILDKDFGYREITDQIFEILGIDEK